MSNYIEKLHELIQETEELYKLIIKLEEISRLELEKRNIHNKENERISFEFINLHNLDERLATLIIDLHENYRYLFGRNGLIKRNTCFEKKILKVYLAGICSMIKENFYHGTTTTFERTTGLKFSAVNNQYYKLLKRAFISEEILPDDWNEIHAHRYKDVLISESGIPADLVSNIIKFFRVYWKYFKGCDIESKKKFLKNIGEKHYMDYKFQYNDLISMKDLYQKIKDYPTKVLKILTQLEDIYFYIEDNDYDSSQLDSEEFYEKISTDLGYDVLTLIPNKRILIKLYEDMLNKVSLGKFKRILKNKPREIPVILPNGNTIINRQYTDYIYGKHNLLDIEYLVLPDTALELEDIFKYPLNTVKKIGDENYLYVSTKEFQVDIGYQSYTSKQVYYNNKSRYIWFDKFPIGRPVQVNNQKINPKNDLNWEVNINYFWNFEEKKYQLCLYIPVIRVYNQKYRSKKISLNCNKSSKNITDFFNKDGYFAKEYIALPLDCLENNSITLKLTVNNEEIIDIKEITLDDIYLFDMQTKQIYKEGKHAITSGNLLVFINKSIIDNGNIIRESFIEKEDFSYYKIYKVDLETLDKIQICDKSWEFTESVRLYFRKIFNLEHNNLDEYSKNIISNIDDINLEIVTNLDQEEIDTVMLTIEKDKRIKQLNIIEIIKREDMKNMIRPGIIKQHFNNLETIIGKWVISIYYKGRRYHTVTYTVIPNITYALSKDIFMEGEELEVTLTSDFPCFYDEQQVELVSKLEKNVGIAEISINDGKFVSEKIEEYLTIGRFGIEKRISLKPDIWGIRVFDRTKNNFLNIDRIHISRLEDLKQYDIAIISQTKGMVTLTISGLIEHILLDKEVSFINLWQYREQLNEVSKISIHRDNQQNDLILTWDTYINELEFVFEGHVITAKYILEGPSIEQYKIVLVSENEGVLDTITIDNKGYKVEKCIDINLLLIKEDKIYIYFDHVASEDRKEFLIDLKEFRKKFDNNKSNSITDKLLAKKCLKDININKESLSIYTKMMLKNDVYKFMKIAKKFAEEELLLEGYSDEY